jgi:hypothetical protein
VFNVQDEAGPQLNEPINLSFLLQLFDPKKQTIKVAGGDLEIRVDLISFILTGNQRIEDKALLDRIPTIVFDKISIPIKAEIIESAWKQNEEHMRLTFSDEMSADISRELAPFKEFVIEKDIESAGCRVCLNVVQGLFNKAQLKYRHTRVREEFKLDVDEIREFIATSFNQEFEKVVFASSLTPTDSTPWWRRSCI